MYNNEGASYIYPNPSGCVAFSGPSSKRAVIEKIQNGDSYNTVYLSANKYNSIYSDSVSKPTVDGIFVLCLIRSH